MPIVLTSDGAIAKAIGRMRAAAANPGPWSRKVREYLLRQTQRKAPRGRGALGKSLNAEGSTDTTVVISSPLPYAGIQAGGGTIRAGTGPLKSKLLAIPMNEEARRMIGGTGTKQSLRKQKDLTLIKSRRGRLMLVRKAKLTKRGKRRPSRRGRRRQHELGKFQIMFLLVPRVKLDPNPPPSGYAPTLADPATRAWIVKSADRHILKGEP